MNPKSTLLFLSLFAGCISSDSGSRELKNTPAPFAVQQTVQAVPELRETNRMKENSTTSVMDKQYAFTCGDKMFFSSPGGEAAMFRMNADNLPILDFSYWGSTKASWGHPFNNSVPDLKLDQETKSITASRLFEAVTKDDSTFTARARLVENGLIEMSYSCAVATGGKLTDRGLFISSAHYDQFAGSRIQIGDTLLTFSSNDTAAGNRTLFEGQFAGAITFFADRSDKAFTLTFPGKSLMYIKEFRKEADRGIPYKYMVQMRVWPTDINGTLKFTLDMRTASPESLKTADAFAGINFWKNDRLHVPNFGASRNLLPNPSFEAGLHYYNVGPLLWGSWPGAHRAVYAIDDTTAKFGKRSLCATTWPDYKTPSALGTFTIPTIPGKKYTFSFWAKADSGGQHIEVACVTGEWMKFPGMRGFTPTTEWRRHSTTFTAPNAAATIAFRPRNNGAAKIGHVWMDGLQVEEGDAATDYVEPPISIALTTGAPGNFVPTDLPDGKKLEAAVHIRAAPNTKGVLTCAVEDFLYREPFSGTFDFTTDQEGEATVKTPLADKLGKGIFVVTTTVKMASGETVTDYHRIVCIDRAPDYANKTIFANIAGLDSQSEAMAARLAWLGFGSSNYQNKEVCDKLMSKYGMANIGGSGVVGYGPGDYSDVSVGSRKALCKRIETEPYSDSLRDETEKVSFEMAKAYPWIRTWFLQAESSGSKFGCLAKNDVEGFVRLILACRTGVLKADPTLKFMFEGGPSNMYPDGGIADYDKWLTAAEKIDPAVRFDAFAIHPYRPVPENPDLDADAATYIKMLERHDYKKEPVYWNEGIYNCPWKIPEWGLDVHRGCSTDHWRAGTPTYHMGWAERMSAAYFARSWLVALKYADRVRQFNGWAMDFVTFDAEMTHYALAKVPNTLGRLLGDATFKYDIRFAVNCRAYLFEDKQGRPVAALWSHYPDVDRGLEKSPVARMHFDGAMPEFFDLMENKVTPQMLKDGSCEVPVTPFPAFIRGNAGTTEALRKSLAAAGVIRSRDFPPYTVRIYRAEEEVSGIKTEAKWEQPPK